jgi:hypothetical protein
MRLTDRVRGWMLYMGVVVDEPSILVVDDVIVRALKAGACLVVGFDVPPTLVMQPSSAARFPQPEPGSEQ